MKQYVEQSLRSLRHLGGALRLVWDSAPGWSIAAAVTAVAQGLIPAASLYLTKLLVDAIAELLAQPAAARDLQPVMTLLPAVGGVMAVGGLCRLLQTLSNEAQATAVSNHVQGILQAKALEVDYQCYEDPRFYDTMRMAHGEAMSRPTRIAHNLTRSLRELLSLVTVTGVLVASHIYLVPVVFLAVIPGTVARLLNSRKLHAWRVRHMADERYASYLNLLLTSAGFAKEMRIFRHGPMFRDHFRGLRERLRSSRLKLTRKRVFCQLAADAASFAIAGGGIALIAFRFSTGLAALTMGDMALLLRAFQRAKGALSGWLASLTALYEDSVFIAHFYDFMALPRTICSPSPPMNPPPPAPTSCLAVENVSFRYPGTDRDVLRDVSFRVRPGEHIALVGENGAGKTTLAKLMCRLYDPDAGRITIDGTDIREFAIDELRSWMGVLFQDYARYYMSAGENIRIGDVSLPKGDPRIEAAAKRAGADSVIAELPQGYETPLGRMFEGGVELSVGQWQRLALARTLVRDAPFVLLDEHTSALDPKAEQAVLDRLFQAANERTLVVISHRLSTVAMVDRVIVLHQGRIVEEGPHDRLMNRGGYYTRLYGRRRGNYQSNTE